MLVKVKELLGDGRRRRLIIRVVVGLQVRVLQRLLDRGVGPRDLVLGELVVVLRVLGNMAFHGIFFLNGSDRMYSRARRDLMP